MVQEDPVVANEGEFVRSEKELTGGNLRSRSAFEAKIGVGVESAQCAKFAVISTPYWFPWRS